ncbi:ROK family protein [Streptomyces sp. NBC_01549]|uniref:ROK family protein n=1 Tax=Streptomyces sp. NBC_01549 TaxID=2975874 RepID=UPI0022546649|nr:ROK family protein [Streptomyces sp. NBC_01549]MCX4595130.1 ROK family protein [Streptomyces sp. NBC_01549]
MQLRYAFRLYPELGQRLAPARAAGARVVFNDAVRAREEARKVGAAFPAAGELSRKLVTEAKRTVERSRLAEVCAVVLQQSLRAAESAYRNFFASLKGERKGAKSGAPCFKSRKDSRQSIRFTANARWSITARSLTARGVAEAAGEGDRDALAVHEAAGAGVARAILITAGLMDLTTCVIGGGVSRAWNLLEPSISATLAAEPPVGGQPIRVVRARSGSRAVAIGAGSRVRTELGAVTRV